MLCTTNETSVCCVRGVTEGCVICSKRAYDKQDSKVLLDKCDSGIIFVKSLVVMIGKTLVRHEGVTDLNMQ